MSLGAWSVQPALIYVALAAALYIVGSRRMGAVRRGPDDNRRVAAFFTGLLVIVLALDSPLDDLADKLFWAHMLQHILLLTVAPPLILLGRPWPRMWRALPLDLRTRLGRGLVRSRIASPLRRLARPWPAWLLFNGALIAWHIPALYDATLRSGWIHQLEHAIFFFTGLLFWARIVDPGPLRPRLSWTGRIAYIVGAMVVGWALAVALVFAPDPIYSAYASLAHRPGGISAMTDQQLAAGMMWVPGSLAYTIAALVVFYQWLEPESAPAKRTPALTH
jgi:putative membrane protein